MAAAQIDKQNVAALLLIEVPERKDGFQGWDA
jgi:hypothetical protein